MAKRLSDITGGFFPDSDLLISKGDVNGVDYINKFGYNADIDIASAEDLWANGGDWVAPTQARQHVVVSDDANDTSAGSGARTVGVEGLDADFNPISETIIMNGSTNVDTVNEYTRIFRMYVITAGSGKINAGNIRAIADTDATTTANIVAGLGQTQLAIYTVPKGRTAFITNYYAYPIRQGNVAIGAQSLVRNTETDKDVWRQRHLTGGHSQGSKASHDFKPYMAVPEKHDIKIRVDVSADNTEIAGGFDIILV